MTGASPEAAARFAELLRERGGGLVPEAEADLIVRIASGNTTVAGRYSRDERGGIWPEIRDGERRLWLRWSAFLVPVGERELHILATTPAAVENALRKVARLRQKLTYTAGPFALQSDRKEP